MWLITLAVAVSAAHAGEIEFGEAKGQGTCEVRGVLKDGRLSLALSGFVATLGSGLKRETCLISVPVSWPKGKQIVVKNLTLSGDFELRNQAQGTARAELFTAATRGERVEVKRRADDGDYRETMSGEVLRTDCTGNGILRVNSSLTLRGERARGAYLSMEKLSARVSVEDCDE